MVTEILSGVIILLALILIVFGVNIEPIKEGYAVYFTVKGIRKEIIIKTK